MIVFQQAIPWWQSGAFGNAMIGLIVALATFIAARAQQNHGKIATIETNTNAANEQLRETVKTLNETALADKDKQITFLQDKQKPGGTTS